MDDLKLSNLPAHVQTVIEPFLKDILAKCKEDIISIYIIGSAVTKDFHPNYSDINTVIVVKDIKIEKDDIRLQCERELKGKLQHLCQGYIKAMGNKMTLTDLFVGSLSGYFPLFRGILFLDRKSV